MQTLHDSLGSLRRLSWEWLEFKRSRNFVQMSKRGNSIKHSKPNANGKLRGLKEEFERSLGKGCSDRQFVLLVYSPTTFLKHVTTGKPAPECMGSPDHHDVHRAPWSGRAVAGTQQTLGISSHFQSCQGNPTPACLVVWGAGVTASTETSGVKTSVLVKMFES